MHLNKKLSLETGQIIPIVVFLIFAIIGMAALILDGGALMSNRRAAQAAADAGALAGAQRACYGYSDAKIVAEHYATVYNDATSALVTVSGPQVTVNTTLEHASFFARIFGEETLVAKAEATAGCFGVRGQHVAPLAWYCRARTAGGPFPSGYGCEMQTLSWQKIGPLVDPNWQPASQRVTSVQISNFAGQTREYTRSGANIVDSAGRPPEQIYIIVDEDKVCLEDGGDFKCDITGDGKKDIQLGGDRGWLYLTRDTSNIGQWVTAPGTGLSLNPHIWLSGKSGVTTSVYHRMIDMGWVGKVVMVPVYNVLCENDPRTDSSCLTAAHASPPWPAFHGEDDFSEMKNSGPHYHIITFAPFYVSCISTSGNCPGYQYARSINSQLKHNGSVVEGFFISDFDVSPDINDYCSINLGNCTISLSN